MAIEIWVGGDLFAPVVVCDHCGQRIEKASEGNYQYLHEGGKVYFTHKKCCMAFEAARGGRLRWAGMPLEVLLVHLAHNLKVDWKKANEWADFLDRI